MDAVARLQKEMAEFRTEFGYGSARRPVSSSKTSGGGGGVGIYVDVGAQVFGVVQLGPISASV